MPHSLGSAGQGFYKSSKSHLGKEWSFFELCNALQGPVTMESSCKTLYTIPLPLYG